MKTVAEAIYEAISFAASAEVSGYDYDAVELAERKAKECEPSDEEIEICCLCKEPFIVSQQNPDSSICSSCYRKG